MDNKTERKWRMRQFRLRSALFLRKNGLYLMGIACLAVLGVAAALLFSRPEDVPAPVSRSDDERLGDVVSASPKPGGLIPTAAPTAAPTAGATFVPITPDPSRTPIPDLTFAPEPTADPTLSKLQPPVDGKVIRVFAVNSLIWSETLQQWMTHPGVDVTANKGDPVYCVLPGTVESVRSDDMLGTVVTVGHENGLKSVYASLKDAPPVKEGDAVAARQIIGYIGDTAISECAERSHLHFELLVNGAPIDPESMMMFNKE